MLYYSAGDIENLGDNKYQASLTITKAQEEDAEKSFYLVLKLEDTERE